MPPDKTESVRTARHRGLAVCLLLLCTVVACETGEVVPHISFVTPNPAYQDKLLQIHGRGFGMLVAGETGVLIAGQCAPVSYWDDAVIEVQVPPGVGVGVRRLTVFTATWAQPSIDITIEGMNLSAPEGGLCDFVPRRVLPSGSQPDVVAPLPDAVARPDTFPTDTGGRVDTSPVVDTSAAPDSGPDFGPDFGVDASFRCWAAVGSGACTNDGDCDAVQRRARDGETVGVDCTLACLPDPDQQACITPCIGEDVGVSAACSACFGWLNLCILDACLSPCVAEPWGDDCQLCMDQACGAAFVACSGLVLEVGP